MELKLKKIIFFSSAQQLAVLVFLQDSTIALHPRQKCFSHVDHHQMFKSGNVLVLIRGLAILCVKKNERNSVLTIQSSVILSH